jgi:hypothetical protein
LEEAESGSRTNLSTHHGDTVHSHRLNLFGGRVDMSPATVRHVVNDVDQALVFYCGLLRFDEIAHPAGRGRFWQRRGAVRVLSLSPSPRD